MRVAAVLLAAAALAAPASAAAPPAKVLIAAPTHRPKAGAPWPYCVMVVDPKRVVPLRAHGRFRILNNGFQVGLVGVHDFYGAWCETIRWPASSKGDELLFEAIVTVGGRKRFVDYLIRVQ